MKKSRLTITVEHDYPDGDTHYLEIKKDGDKKELDGVIELMAKIYSVEIEEGIYGK
jgi:hypothetical protein